MPWNYPQLQNGTIDEICDGERSFCFESAMGDPTRLMNCSCMADCEEIRFDMAESQYPMNYQKVCQTGFNKISLCNPGNLGVTMT